MNVQWRESILQVQIRQLRLSSLEWLAVVLLLLAAFALRIVAFSSAPPGIIHDEVRNWLNTRLIVAGDIRALYPYGGGREAFYLFIQTLSFSLIGDNILGARLPSLAFSMLGVAATFSLARRFLGRAAALVAGAGISVSFWALMFARLAVRTGSMPVMALLTAYAFERLITAHEPPLWRYGLAGLLLGLTLYTYPSSLIFPVILLLWMIVMALLRWRSLSRQWRPLALSFVLPVLMAVPLAAAWSDPGVSARADEVNAPLEALFAGDIQPVLDNVGPVLGVFSVRGDHGLEFNIQDQPIFPTPALAGLFYVGLAMSVVGLFMPGDARRPGLLLMLLWLLLMLAPTLVTERPVNPSRTIGLLGVVYFFPAVVVSSVSVRSWPRFRYPALGLCALVAVLTLGWEAINTTRAYFFEWVDNPVVRFLYQDEYRVLAHDLRVEGITTPLAVGGLTPDEMDPASLRLLLPEPQYIESVGFFDPQTALLVPPSDVGVYVIVPDSASIHPALAKNLEGWGFRVDPPYGSAPYIRLLLPGNQAGLFQGAEQLALEYVWPGTENPLIELVGVESTGSAAPGESSTVLTYWRTRGASPRSLRIFVHLTDESGTMVAQSDVLGVPATQWRPGDLIIQAHDFAVPLLDTLPGPYWLNVGLYDPVTGVRLTVAGQPQQDLSRLPLP